MNLRQALAKNFEFFKMLFENICHARYSFAVKKIETRSVFALLTILTGKTCALLNSVQKFIEIQG